MSTSSRYWAGLTPADSDSESDPRPGRPRQLERAARWPGPRAHWPGPLIHVPTGPGHGPLGLAAVGPGQGLQLPHRSRPVTIASQLPGTLHTHTHTHTHTHRTRGGGGGAQLTFGRLNARIHYREIFGQPLLGRLAGGFESSAVSDLVNLALNTAAVVALQPSPRGGAVAPPVAAPVASSSASISAGVRTTRGACMLPKLHTVCWGSVANTSNH